MSFFDYGAAASPADSTEPTFMDSVDDAEWTLLRSYCEIRRYSADAVITTAGSPDRSLYVLLEGEVSLRAPGRGGRRKQVTIRTREILGEVTFFDGRPRKVDFVAIGECEILVLSFENYQRLTALEPALAQTLLFDVGRILAHRFRVLTRLSGSTL